MTDAEVDALRAALSLLQTEYDRWVTVALERRTELANLDATVTAAMFALSDTGGADGWRPPRGVSPLIDRALDVREARDAERKRADSLALAYRQEQGANDALRRRTEQAERDAEDAEKGAAACDQIVALLDGIPVEAPCPEAARVAKIISEVERLRELGDGYLLEMGRQHALLRKRAEEIEKLKAHRELCTENLLKGYETGKAEERAAVAAWLREHWSEVLEQTPQQTAKLIERGEHRRKVQP